MLYSTRGNTLQGLMLVVGSITNINEHLIISYREKKRKLKEKI